MMRIDDVQKNLGMHAEALFLDELRLCEADKDEQLATFAEKAVVCFGRANYDEHLLNGEFLAMADHAIRFLDMLPPANEKVSCYLNLKHSFPFTKARLCRFLLIAIQYTEKEEQYLKFASALMSPRNAKTEEERRAVMAVLEQDIAERTRCTSMRARRNIVSILRQMPYRAENPIFRKLLSYIATSGTKEDLKELINFHKEKEEVKETA
jgi:hypothetical protein